MSYLASSSNAVARSAQAKFGDVASVLDFGAVADAIVITGSTSITSGTNALRYYRGIF
jgi:hypothetical protein